MSDVSHDHRQTPPTDGDPTLDDLAAGLTASHRHLMLRLIRSVKDGQITSRDLQGVTEADGPDAVLAAVQRMLDARPALQSTDCPAWCVHPEECAVEAEAHPWREIAHDGEPTTVNSAELEVTVARRALHPADEPYEPGRDTVKIDVVSRMWRDLEVDGFLSLTEAQDIADALTAEVQA